MQLLVEYRAVVKVRNNDEWTVLQVTAKKGHEMVMRLLVENEQTSMQRIMMNERLYTQRLGMGTKW